MEQDLSGFFFKFDELNLLNCQMLKKIGDEENVWRF